MSQQLISRSPDLQRLAAEGFELEVRDGFALVHHVPYVTAAKQIKYGTLVSTLSLAGDQTTRPDTHLMYFAGEYPCSREGQPIEPLRHNSARQQLTAHIVVDHSFSSKPITGYTDYYDKFVTYINILLSPARAIDSSVTACTFASVQETQDTSPFVYSDTSSSRYGISAITSKLSGQRIAIVGLGGTGSYILDLVAKTSVREIHIFDGDALVSHNAFRAPGAATLDELRARPTKVEHFAAIYRHMHRGIVAHAYYLDAGNAHELNAFTYVFLCVDRAAAKAVLFASLQAAKVPFIDVGIGIESIDAALLGMVRVTTVTPSQQSHISARVSFHDDANDIYHTPIQTADLNMLNAALAVIKWKKLSGLYQDLEHEHNSIYTVNVNALASDDYDT